MHLTSEGTTIAGGLGGKVNTNVVKHIVRQQASYHYDLPFQ